MGRVERISVEVPAELAQRLREAVTSDEPARDGAEVMAGIRAGLDATHPIELAAGRASRRVRDRRSMPDYEPSVSRP